MSVPRVTSATDPWRVKAIARQHSGTAERPGSDLPFGAGQQSWLAHGRRNRLHAGPRPAVTTHRAKCTSNTSRINPQRHSTRQRPPSKTDSNGSLSLSPLAIFCRYGRQAAAIVGHLKASNRWPFSPLEGAPLAVWVLRYSLFGPYGRNCHMELPYPFYGELRNDHQRRATFCVCCVSSHCYVEVSTVRPRLCQ